MNSQILVQLPTGLSIAFFFSLFLTISAQLIRFSGSFFDNTTCTTKPHSILIFHLARTSHPPVGHDKFFYQIKLRSHSFSEFPLFPLLSQRHAQPLESFFPNIDTPRRLRPITKFPENILSLSNSF
ncbi:hypothetical protein F4774DRAFT_33812 [Daldinia eschscholtzii]|nr:hypothetical protein F4774DRAFT_33812 [Daldinia eschscholtzii]